MKLSTQQEKFIAICAPSGSGKTTIYKQLLKDLPLLSKSISAATRNRRGEEVDGVDYYFISLYEFESKIKNNEFVEWEKVYEGKFYGTLKSEIKRIHELGKIPLLDIDVKGAQAIKKIYGENALIIFIKVPLDIIKERLLKRGTDSTEDIQARLLRTREEYQYESKCDQVVLNIDLAEAQEKTKTIVENFLNS